MSMDPLEHLRPAFEALSNAIAQTPSVEQVQQSAETMAAVLSSAIAQTASVEQIQRSAETMAAVTSVAMRHLAIEARVWESLAQLQANVAGAIAAVNRSIQLGPEFIEALGRLLRESRAPNWPDQRDLDVYEFVQRTKWPLVWVPDEPLVRDLLDADEADLELVLLDNADAVLCSCSNQLQTLPSDWSPALVEAATQCVTAFPQAPMAAQALAAVTFENLVLGPMGHTTLTKASKDLATQAAALEDVSHRLLRWALISYCMPDALQTFWASKGDPVPHQFNRHASIHTLSDEQYTATNALVGIMLITAALRELHHADCQGAP